VTAEQTTLPPATKVTGPGVYDLPAEDYHADPVLGGSLSSTGARTLLPPSCPALFQYEHEHGAPTKRVWEIGSAAHKLILGIGPKLVLVDRPRWDTNEVKKELKEIRERGDIPLKLADYEQIRAMAKALGVHPFAGQLFKPGTGRPEQTLVWQDRETGVWCRALLDWLPFPTASGRIVIPDYKSCLSAAPDKFARAMADHGYHIQLAWYLAGVRALDLGDERSVGVLVAQEKTPPYLVTVAQPDPTAMRMGEIRMREALRLYAECIASGRWPGYADDVVLASLPPWETRELNGEVW
jgi:glycine/D-amino acid oxidase-like deaminating enzyme